MDNGILKVGENFETCDQRNAIEIVAIHVADLLISWSGVFVEYITQRTKGEFEVDSYGGTEATYLGWESLK